LKGTGMYGLTCGYCGETIDRETENEVYLAAQESGWRYVKDDLGNWHNACPSCIEDDDETEDIALGV
jgi:hypothetical protein